MNHFRSRFIPNSDRLPALEILFKDLDSKLKSLPAPFAAEGGWSFSRVKWRQDRPRKTDLRDPADGRGLRMSGSY